MPDYKQIYTDILEEKFPEKLTDHHIRYQLEALYSAIDVLKFNQLIFGEPDYTTGINNQQLRSYDKESVLKILRYQQKNKLTNLQLSSHYKISRNTIAWWKAIFKI